MYFRMAMEIGFAVSTIIFSMVTVVLCHFSHGEFDVDYLFHPIRVRYEQRNLYYGFMGIILLHSNLFTQFTMGSDHANRIFW